MEGLIPIVNKLQDAFTRVGAPLPSDFLPQIAVVGSQSAGKSSVLENFVGRDFLPRGSGIVTRRPLILQLFHDSIEYATFLHTGEKRFTDFNEVRNEIERETERVVGKTKNVSKQAISLRVHSPHVVNLTLIDLPGLTKIPVGNQPQDIESIIRDMILDFIESPNCIILAVSPANNDLANSDAIKLAREVDPTGERTIGVLTKLDLMDQGTDARDILINKEHSLCRQFIGVVNRSQKDIDSRKNITASLEAERQFFASHPAYHDIKDKHGTSFLQKELSSQLTNHIRSSLPNLEQKLLAKKASLQREVDMISGFHFTDASEKTKVMIHQINQMKSRFNESIDGTSGTVSTDKLSGGARIFDIFHQSFRDKLIDIQWNDEERQRETQITIRNIQGVHGGIFTPDAAFEALVKKHIKLLKDPSITCVSQVSERVREIILNSTEHMRGVPRLRDEVEKIVIQRLCECECIARSEIDKFLNFQSSYINIQHEDFNGLVEPGVGEQPAEQQDKLICKGWLKVVTDKAFSNSSTCWCVLTNDSFSWYKNETETEKKYHLALEGSLRQKPADSSMFSRKPGITLFYDDGGKKNVYRDHKYVTLVFENASDVKDWSKKLAQAGVYMSSGDSSRRAPERTSEPDQQLLDDPNTKRQVQCIINLVDSYMRIVLKTQMDIVPKIVMFTLIIQLKEFLEMGLLSSLYKQDIDELMMVSPDEQQRRDNLICSFKEIEETLAVITDILRNTTYTPKPKPLSRPEIKLFDDRPPAASHSSRSASQTLRRAPVRPAPTLTGPTVTNGNGSAMPPPIVPDRAGSGSAFQSAFSHSMNDLAAIRWDAKPAATSTQSNAASLLFENWDPFGPNAGRSAEPMRPSTSASAYAPNTVLSALRSSGSSRPPSAKAPPIPPR